MIKIENKIFRNIEEFKKDVCGQTTQTNGEKIDTINHEIAHFNKARELGYNPTFGKKDILLRIPLPFVYLDITMKGYFIVDNFKLKDLGEIALAPTNPSRRDKIMFYFFPNSQKIT